MAKKAKRVEVKDRQGNIARPLVRDLDKWISAGWTPVEEAEARADDDQVAPSTVMARDT